MKMKASNKPSQVASLQNLLEEVWQEIGSEIYETVSGESNSSVVDIVIDRAYGRMSFDERSALPKLHNILGRSVRLI